jgi:exosortase/archaeosortase
VLKAFILLSCVPSAAVLFYIQDLEGKIVTACAGMPLVLELAGGQLQGVRDPVIWKVRAIRRYCGVT